MDMIDIALRRKAEERRKKELRDLVADRKTCPRCRTRDAIRTRKLPEKKQILQDCRFCDWEYVWEHGKRKGRPKAGKGVPGVDPRAKEKKR